MLKDPTRPTCRRKLRPIPGLVDAVPGLYPEQIGKIAKDPNTDYQRRIIQFHQREGEYITLKQDSLKKALDDERLEAKYMTHAEHKRFARRLKDKVDIKMEQYEENINRRRLALTDMLCVEERELTREVVTNLQANISIQDKLDKINKIKEEKEAATKAFVAEKRMQQYVLRCEELRPKITKARCMEAAEAQKIQRQELAAKRQSEKELEQLWHELMLKYCEAIDEREEQDKLKKQKQVNEFKFYSDLQEKEKMAREQQLQKEKMEEKERLNKLKKDIEDEERAFKEMKERKRIEAKEKFVKELKQRKDLLDDLARKEQEIQNAYDKLVEDEIERENAKEKAKVSTALQDLMTYNKYLADMKKQEMEDDARMHKIIEKTMNDIYRKEDEETCKDLTQRKELLQTVLKERRQQLEEKRRLSEQVKKEKEMEATLLKATIDKSLEMDKEYRRVCHAAAQKYKDDLQQQINYNKVLEERERENMRKILQLAKEENDKYDKIVASVLTGNVKVSETHTFRRVIDNEKCKCLKPNY